MQVSFDQFGQLSSDMLSCLTGVTYNVNAYLFRWTLIGFLDGHTLTCNGTGRSFKCIQLLKDRAHYLVSLLLINLHGWKEMLLVSMFMMTAVLTRRYHYHAQ